jgi:peptide/nickel transport system substrate-binding protein
VIRDNRAAAALLSVMLLAGGCGQATTTGQVTPSSQSQGAPSTAASPSAGTPSSGPGTPTGVVRVALHSFGQEKTAMWQGGGVNQPYIEAMYDPFIAADAQGNLTKDGILQDWEVTSDGLQYLFKIRPGVKFHNGVEVTAKDIQFSLETFTREGLPLALGPTLRALISKMEVVDEHTLRITLNRPNAAFINFLSWIEGGLAVVPKDYFESLPGANFDEKSQAFADKPIGTGPFRFVRREIGRTIEFQANTDYYDKSRIPKFESLILTAATEPATRMSMLQTNEADVIEADPQLGIQGAAAGFKVFEVENVLHIMMAYIKSYEPKYVTNDVRVRQALTLAVDRKAITTGLFPEIPGVGPTGVVATGPGLSGPGIAGYRPDLASYPYDPEQARRLLADAGYNDHPQVIVVYIFPETYPQVLQSIAQYWNAVGVKTELRTVDGAAFFPRLFADPQQFNEPSVYLLDQNYRPSGVTNLRGVAASKKQGNLINHQDPEEVDRLILGAESANPANFDAEMAKVWTQMYGEYWSLPVPWINATLLADSKVVTHYSPVPHGYYYPRWETLAP